MQNLSTPSSSSSLRFALLCNHSCQLVFSTVHCHVTFAKKRPSHEKEEGRDEKGLKSVKKDSERKTTKIRKKGLE